MSEASGASEDPVIIKKYANRRLYNTTTSSYVTLDDLAAMVKAGTHFLVRDAKSGDNITRSVLTQIIFEEEGKSGQNLLPINFLRQLIGFYGDSMQAFVPSYLEFSLDTLMKEQEKFRAQIVDAIGGDPLNMVEEQTKRNMAMFQQAMTLFNPFAAMQESLKPGAKPAAGAEPPAKSAGDDLKALKDQMLEMQKQLEKLSRDSG